jgi:putative CocE/NonD family hydrolase
MTKDNYLNTLPMKKLSLFIIFNAWYVLLIAQNPDSTWIVNNYIKMERQISMRDGIKLFTSIYVPKDTSENHPILMTRTPYSCYPYGENKWREFWNSYTSAYFREGYIIVIQDVRGRWMSEGEFVDVRPFIADKKSSRDIDEASDTYDAIDWLVKNIPHNNGKVGVFGVSYPGFYSTMAAASNHPALVAVSPQAPVTNWFIGDDFHHNGAFFIMDAFSFYSPLGGGFGLPRPKPTTEGPKTVGISDHDSYKFYLETGPLPAFMKLTGDSVKFWNDLYAHPNYDQWWKSRDARNATKNLHPAMLWVGGLFDAEDNWGAWNSYKAAEANNPGKKFNKLVMGPWYHGQWETHNGTHLGNIHFGSNTSTWYQQNIEIPFFNYFLKGKGDVSTIPEATIFISGENKWAQFDQWPPANKTDKVLYLKENGSLGWSKPTSSSGFTEYISDPDKPVPYTAGIHFVRTREYMTDDQRFAGCRPDVLTFKTEILSEDVTVTGPFTADLFASISTTDADFVVKLIDVFPDTLSYNDVDIYAEKDPVLIYPMGGYQMLVHGEIFRGRYRKSFENPEPFVPGKIERVKFTVGDIAHTFKKGHRIMVQIQSSWFPLADRNPQKFVNIYKASQSDFQKATIRIYHDEKNASNIVLPVLIK